jgi:transcriptional regulator with XRE-family HTH domain
MAIDAALGRLGIQTGVCTSSTRPANPYEGQVIYETDTNNLRFWSGSAWESNKGAVISSAAPTSPAAGDIWYDSDDGRAYVYYDDGSSQQWVEFGAPPVQHGKILQVVSTTKTDTFSTASSSFVDITGLSVSITPTSASSKILVMAHITAGVSANSGYNLLLRDSTIILQGDAASSRPRISVAVMNTSTYEMQTTPVVFLDSPSTTSSATGIFEGTVFFTVANESSGHRLRVAEGDTVTAEYEDNTLPSFMSTALNQHLGKKLRLRRVALGLTQTQVAQAINVTFQQIQKYEKGTNGVSSARLLQLSNFLNVQIKYFFEDFSEFENKEEISNQSLNYAFLSKLFSELEPQEKQKILEVLRNQKEFKKVV